MHLYPADQHRVGATATPVTTPVRDWSVEDLPILGEPFAVEFANTLYDSGGEVIDFLGTIELARLWFEHAPAAEGFVVPRRLSREDLSLVREIRNAVHRVLVGCVDDSGVAARDVEKLNGYARTAPVFLQLQPSTAGTWQASLSHTGRSVDSLVAGVATRSISFVGSDEFVLVRRCERTPCPMFFVQLHHRRRFCHDGCSHRQRQACYVRRQRLTTLDSKVLP